MENQGLGVLGQKLEGNRKHRDLQDLYSCSIEDGPFGLLQMSCFISLLAYSSLL